MVACSIRQIPESTFLLSGVDITYADDSEFFLRCTGNENRRGWGSVGSNGADCLFTAKEQEMQGDVIWDSVSDLDFYMTDGSTLTGAVVDDESCAGEGGDGVCNFYISDDSTWVVTGDSTLTESAVCRHDHGRKRKYCFSSRHRRNRLCGRRQRVDRYGRIL